MTEPIRVLLAEDHQIVRGGLRALLAHHDHIDVIDEAVDGMEAVFKARTLQPDVILMDLMMPRKSGLEAIIEIKQHEPNARILVLTSYAEDEHVFSAIKAGALGYLLKETSPKDLLQAIQDVYQGEASLHPSIARRLLREFNRPTATPATDEPLTEREVEVIVLIAQGYSNQMIGDLLFISERTVRTHVSNILSKLHLANRTQAALYALKERLTELAVRPR